MKTGKFLSLLFSILLLFACKKETIPFSEFSLERAMEETGLELSSKPLEWEDKDLQFLEELK